MSLKVGGGGGTTVKIRRYLAVCARAIGLSVSFPDPHAPNDLFFVQPLPKEDIIVLWGKRVQESQNPGSVKRSNYRDEIPY